MKEMWQDAMLEAFRETSRRLVLFLPKLLALLTFLALGLLAGWLVKMLLMRVLLALRWLPLARVIRPYCATLWLNHIC